jgi:hypothetical protein
MQSATPSQASSEAVPTTSWQLTVNDPAGFTNITVPNAGVLYVFYEPQQPAKAIYVQHQGGSKTAINEGGNTIPVSAQDFIVYQPFNPSTDSIKLGYQML